MDSQSPQESQGGASASPHTRTPSKPENTPRRISESASAIPLPHKVASWPRNSREVIQVKLDRYQGRETIDLRTWYSSDEGELRPGKGLTLAVSHLPALAKALTEALAIACKAGLVEGGEQ